MIDFTGKQDWARPSNPETLKLPYCLNCNIMKKITKAFFILLTLAGLCACAVSPGPVCEKSGQHCKTEGRFTGQWYDYYKRAISCMKDGCYDAAIPEFREAQMRRPGDSRWANTYGMHFMSYFPHRETGVSYYFLGDDDAARNELELSVRLEPSAKAYFYLDKVRQRIMRKKKWESGSPDIFIISPDTGAGLPREIRTREDPVIISGRAEDRRYVSEISVSGRPVFMELSARQVEFREGLNLAQGTHRAEITARNLLGGEARHEILIHVDRAGPFIIIKEFSRDKIRGYVRDDSDVASLFADTDGNREDILFEKDGAFVIPLLRRHKPRMGTIRLLAEDTLGNKTQISLKADGRAKIALLAQNTSDIVSDISRTFSAPGKTIAITLSGWEEQTVVFKRNVDIEGEIRGETDIEYVELVTENHSDTEKPRTHRIQTFNKAAGPLVSFNQCVSLEQGENTLTVKAGDKVGRTEIRKIFITRKTPDAFQPEHRYAIRMYSFDMAEQEKTRGIFGEILKSMPILWNGSQFMEPGTRAWFQHFLMENFRIGNRFQLTEEEQLKTLFSEHRIRDTVSDPDSFKQKSRKQKQPHALFLGNTWQDRNGTEIIARLVDIRTSEIIMVKDVYGDSGTLASMAEKLSEKFHRAIPLADSRVADIRGSRIYTLFSEKQIMEGWPILVYRQEKPAYNAVTGKSLGSDTRIIADASMEKDASALVNHQKVEIRLGDKVITR